MRSMVEGWGAPGDRSRAERTPPPLRGPPPHPVRDGEERGRASSAPRGGSRWRGGEARSAGALPGTGCPRFRGGGIIFSARRPRSAWPVLASSRDVGLISAAPVDVFRPGTLPLRPSRASACGGRGVTDTLPGPSPFHSGEAVPRRLWVYAGRESLAAPSSIPASGAVSRSTTSRAAASGRYRAPSPAAGTPSSMTQLSAP